MVLGDYYLPAGTDIMINLAGIQRDPHVWPNPHEFNPDRFLPAEVEKRSRYSYMPFSAGVRKCPGNIYLLFL